MIRYMHKKAKTQERIFFPFPCAYFKGACSTYIYASSQKNSETQCEMGTRIRTRTHGAFHCPFTTHCLRTYMFPVLELIAKLQMYPPYSHVRSDNTHTNSENLSCLCRVLSHLFLVSTWLLEHTMLLMCLLPFVLSRVTWPAPSTLYTP